MSNPKKPKWSPAGAPRRGAKWLTLAETAEYLGLSSMSVTRYVNDKNYGHLGFPKPAVLVDSWRWHVSDLDAWMRSRIGAASSRKRKTEAA
jgi:predicted DNA-binding transcriptional regulator AlpA